MKNVQQQIGRDGSLWARRELHCFPSPCLGPPGSQACSHAATSAPEGMEVLMYSQLCAEPEQLRKAYPNCSLVLRPGQGTQGWPHPTLQQTHRAQITNPKNQNNILPHWGKGHVHQVGGGAWCFHWRPAHLQLSSGEEQHNQAELKWALGCLWVGCRAQGRLGKVCLTPPRRLLTIFSWRKSLPDTSGPV